MNSPNHSGLGTMAWAEITRGRLSRSDRRRQILTVLGIRLDRMARRIIGRGPVRRTPDLDAIVVPDSRSALAALELCQATSTPSLANHCLRTYFWGALLGQTEHRRYDPELFFTASLLHDLGLNDGIAFKSEHPCCFAYEGAMAAETFAREQQWPDDRRRALGDAICQHLNVRVPAERGVEAHLLHAGAGADVLGTRMDELNPGARDEVIRRYPRLDFKEELIRTLGPQVEKRPDSRIAFLFSVGFPKLVRAAPFSE